jgi:hypothetical protein
LPIPADVNGDDRDDLVYRAPCDDGECWFSQTSDGTVFAAPVILGRVMAGEDRLIEMIDFDRDGRADLVSHGNDAEQSTITVRLVGDDGFADPVRVARFEGEVTSVYLRQVAEGSPVEAVVHVSCGTRTTCVETRVASSGRLADPADYAAQREAAKLPDVS